MPKASTGKGLRSDTGHFNENFDLNTNSITISHLVIYLQ